MVDYAVWKRYPELNPIDLWPEGQVPHYCAEYGQDVPFITPFLLPGKDNPVILVVPGGGYEAKAEHESRNIAEHMNALGFSCFVLDYRVRPYAFPIPQLDAQRAVRYIRCHAQEFGVHPDKIIAMGFSAGGHLSVSISVHGGEGDPNAADPVERVSARPNAMVLVYAVVNMAKHARRIINTENFLPEYYDAYYQQVMEPVQFVNENTVPAFLWQTSDDNMVDPHNSLELYSALQKHGVPVEMHLYRHGHHGLNLAQNVESINTWPTLCAQFLRQLGF